MALLVWPFMGGRELMRPVPLPAVVVSVRGHFSHVCGVRPACLAVAAVMPERNVQKLFSWRGPGLSLSLVLCGHGWEIIDLLFSAA